MIFIGGSVPWDLIIPTDVKQDGLFIFQRDNLSHFFGFGFFSWFLCYDFFKKNKIPVPLLRIGLYSLGYGLFLECWQLFLPYRSFELSDLVVDLSGIALSIFFFKYFFLKRKPNTEYRETKNVKRKT